MLGKLIKHEFKATSKIYGLLFGATLILSILSAFSFYVPFDNFLVDLISSLIMFTFILSVAGGILFSFIIMIRRYYNHMLKDEGYLTHTLPVKMWQIITSKLITNSIWMVASVGVSLLALFIFFTCTGDIIVFFDNMETFFGVVGDYPRIILYIVIIVIIIFLQFIDTLLCIFAALSIGQKLVKHKIFGSVAFYFILNYAMGIVTSVLFLLIPNFITDMNKINSIKIETFDEFMYFIDPVFMKMFLVTIICEIIMGVVYFVITNVMMSKKLNLE